MASPAAPSPGPNLVRRAWRLVERSPLRGLAWTVRRAPRTGRVALGTRLARVGARLAGAQDLPPQFGSGSSWRRLPRGFVALPRAVTPDRPWPVAPVVEKAGAVVRSIYETGARPPAMDLAMLEQLNEEYSTRPLVAEPPRYDQTSRVSRAQSRLLAVHKSIDLAGKRVLELGCGAGFEVWYLSHHFGADAWGVDVSERVAWATLADERTHFVCADLAVDHPFDPDSIDRVISFSVLEHVVHPHAVIRELYRIMRPGGLAWMSANLHRGPSASHLYRELTFPFPHLLFSDDVIRAWREKHRGISDGAAWVNRLTWAEYEDLFRETGFRMRSLRFAEVPLDEALYERFSDILGRYPRWDLEKDFFYTVLEKPR